MHKAAKFLGVQQQPNYEVMHSQFHGAKFLGVQHTSMKCSYYSLFLLFLGIHIKASQKYLISQCNMKGQNEPLSDTDTSTNLELVALDKFMMFSAMCIYICIYIHCTTFNFTTANLFLQTKKTTNHQTYKRYSGRHCII